MDESPVAAQVWSQLQGLGCLRSVDERSGTVVVEIHLGDTLIGSGAHAVPALANSTALLAAMRHVNAGRGGRPRQPATPMSQKSFDMQLK